MIIAHAEHVGSLLRPQTLLQAREARAAGHITPAAFKVIEDRAVAQAVALQQSVGMPIVTDGEYRRLSFQSVLAEAVEGLGAWGLDAFLWGDWRGDAESVGNRRVARPETLGVTHKLRRRHHLCVEELVSLRSLAAQATPKVTLPSPSLWANFWSGQYSRGAYPTLEGFLADVVDILREEVAELARLGASYIQLDAPHYTLLLDPATRAFYEGQGWRIEDYLQRGIDMDNAVIDAAPGVTFGFHLCRGNQSSRWLVSGDYARIARPIFARMAAQRLLLEYDDARSGSFEALTAVPQDKTVVLGLLTTKRARLESVGELTERVRYAAHYVPLERLALSPQCGFSTSVVGNAVSWEAQERKLRRAVDVAGEIWG